MVLIFSPKHDQYIIIKGLDVDEILSVIFKVKLFYDDGSGSEFIDEFTFTGYD